MTRYKAEQEAEQSLAATQVGIEFYQLPPLLQLRLAPLYRQRLKAFGVRNVDTIIVLPSQAELMAPSIPEERTMTSGETQAAQTPVQAPPMSLAA
jgi:hypothetical protein